MGPLKVETVSLKILSQHILKNILSALFKLVLESAYHPDWRRKRHQCPFGGFYQEGQELGLVPYSEVSVHPCL